MFTSLELGRDEREVEAGGLSLKKNPLLVSIIDGCETLKALIDKAQLKPDDVAGAKAIIFMRTDKVGGDMIGEGAAQRAVNAVFVRAARARLCAAAPLQAPTGRERMASPPRQARGPATTTPVDWFWHLCDAGLWPHHHAAAEHARWLVGGPRALQHPVRPPAPTCTPARLRPMQPSAIHPCCCRLRARLPRRSAPLPLKVDGFSMGAVVGYSEQKSVVVLGSDDDVAVFLKARCVDACARCLCVRTARVCACGRSRMRSSRQRAHAHERTSVYMYHRAAHDTTPRMCTG